jgi:cell division protein FtsI (penicillin-binding protein 3)
VARLSRRRIRLLVGIGALAFGAISARAAWVGVVQHDVLAKRSTFETRHQFDVTARRGAILARDLSELAVDAPVVFVSANPTRIRDIGADPTDIATRIGPILGLPVKAIEEKLRRQSGHEPLRRDLSPEKAKALRALRIDGINTEDVHQRVYPRVPSASQLLGFLDSEGTGVEGLEARFEERLTGVDGRVDELRDPKGRTVRILGNRPSVGGKTIRTTIDADIQDVTEEALAQAVLDTGAKSASAVVMRVRDGAVYSIASAPSFDPTKRAKLEQGNVRNRAVTDVFEPGSVFKIVTIAGAIDEGVVAPSTSFYVKPKVSLFGEEVGEAHAREAQTMTVSRILQVSSNVGTIDVARTPNDTAGKARFLRWADRLGFAKSSGIDIPGEDAGDIRSGDRWDGLTIANFPIGQGLRTNLTQLARAYAAVANGGLLVTPHVVDRVGGEGVPVAAPTRVMKASTAGAVNEMLQSVVSETPGATGGRAAIPGFTVAGKTGTANIYDPAIINDRTGKLGAYSTVKHYSTFVGFVPANKPRLVIAVSLDQPVNRYYGGEVAAPVFKQIAEVALNDLGLRPDRALTSAERAAAGG